MLLVKTRTLRQPRVRHPNPTSSV